MHWNIFLSRGSRTQLSPTPLYSFLYLAISSKVSELRCPLPPSLIIPSSRVSAVAVAAYTLLGNDGAKVLVQGPTGAGKTVLLSHLLRVCFNTGADIKIAAGEQLPGGSSAFTYVLCFCYAY